MAVSVAPGYYNKAAKSYYARPGRVAVSGQAVQILLFAPDRVSAVVKNYGTDGVFVGDSRFNLSEIGHYLAPGDALSLTTPCELYGVANSGTQPISTLEEMVT